jgi:hypothetical protein
MIYHVYMSVEDQEGPEPLNARIKSLCAVLPAEIFTGDFNV